MLKSTLKERTAVRMYPYGQSAYRVSSSSADLSLKRYRFTGKERDEETGLDYFGVRYYASWLGRWISADPRGFVDGLNLYRYARNNPVNGVDREGYSTENTDVIDDPDKLIENVRTETQNQINKLEAEIENYKWAAEGSEEQKDYWADRIGEVRTKISSIKDELKKFNEEIEELEKSSVLYKLSLVSERPTGFKKEEKGENVKGGIYLDLYDPRRNTVELLVFSVDKAGNKVNSKAIAGTTSHEMKHLDQYENRFLAFNYDGSRSTIYDGWDELEAFNRSAKLGLGREYTMDMLYEGAYSKLKAITKDENASVYTISSLTRSLKKNLDTRARTHGYWFDAPQASTPVYKNWEIDFTFGKLRQGKEAFIGKR